MTTPSVVSTVKDINQVIVALRPTQLNLTEAQSVSKLKALAQQIKEIHGGLKPVAFTATRRALLSAQVTAKDLHHALATDAPITVPQIEAEISSIQQGLREARAMYREEKCVATPGRPQIVKAEDEEGHELVQNAYEKMRKVPTSLANKRAFILVDKVPVAVIGIYGATLNAMARYFKVVPYIGGYALLDNQQVLAVDLERAKLSVQALGHKLKNKQPKEQAYEIAQQLLLAYNEKHPATALTLMAEDAATWGKLIYFWVAPTRLYNKLYSANRFKIGNGDGPGWGFPSNLDLLRKQGSVADEKIDEIFKLALEYAAQPKEYSAVYDKVVRADSLAQLQAKGVPTSVQPIRDSKTGDYVATWPTLIYGRTPKEIYDQGVPNTVPIKHEPKVGPRKRQVDFLRIAELTKSDSRFVELLIRGKMQPERTVAWRAKYKKLLDSY